MTEAGEIQLESADKEKPVPPQFKKIKLKPGKHTSNFIEQHPRFEGIPEAYPEIFIANPGQEEATIVLSGYKDEHTNTFLHTHGTDIIRKTNDTLITVGWPRLTDVYDIRWRSIADYLAENHPRGVKIFGTSFGGRETLIGLSILKRLADKEGFSVPIESVAIVVAPTSKDTIQPRKKMGMKTWLAMQAAKVEPLFEKLTLRAIPYRMPEKLKLPGGKTVDLWGVRAETVRIRELARGRRFQKGDFPEGLTIHYFGTDPKGELDPLVNQPKAIAELSSAEVNIREHWYKPNPGFAHYPAPDEIPRMMNEVLELFSQIDRVK